MEDKAETPLLVISKNCRVAGSVGVKKPYFYDAFIDRKIQDI